MSPSRRTIPWALVSVVAVIAGTTCLVVLAADAPDGGKPSAKVKELLGQKLALLKELHDLQVRALRQGEANAEALRDTRRGILDVELALSETAEERIRIHDRMVRDAREYEDLVAKLVAAAKVPLSQLLQAKVFRLDAEIARAQAEAQTKLAKEPAKP